MNYQAFTNDSLTMMYEGVRGALALRALSATKLAWPDQIAAGLCGGCSGGDCSGHAASRDATDDLRVRRPAHQAGLKPILVPIPFAAWHALTWISEMFPNPPLTRNQVELMQIDTVSSPEMPGFDELGISPHPVEEILQKMLANFRGGLA
jgi:hypothetical protein